MTDTEKGLIIGIAMQQPFIVSRDVLVNGIRIDATIDGADAGALTITPTLTAEIEVKDNEEEEEEGKE